MSNLSKKIRDEQDKKLILKMTGKTPKHRCPVCHRFTLWINKENSKNQCLMCEIIRRKEVK